MEECIFCKIVAEAIPSKKIYENELATAFLDISPVSNGHALIIPKRHFTKAHEMDTKTWEATADAMSEVTKKLVEKLGVTDYNILQNNGKKAFQEVMHVHFHIIPKTDKSGLLLDSKKTKEWDLDKTIKLLTD